MFSIFILLFLALFFALFSDIFKGGKRTVWVRFFRIFIVVISVGVFAYLFVIKSMDAFIKDSLTVQVINKMPLPLDFYLIKIDQKKNSPTIYETRNIGSIRSEHYRLEYLKVKNSDEFWLVGFIGKKDLVYFSQHYIPNVNEDQNIEVKNYKNQSEKLSAIAKTKIEDLKLENSNNAVWVTLDLLLLFLNIVLLFKKRKQKIGL